MARSWNLTPIAGSSRECVRVISEAQRRNFWHGNEFALCRRSVATQDRLTWRSSSASHTRPASSYASVITRRAFVCLGLFSSTCEKPSGGTPSRRRNAIRTARAFGPIGMMRCRPWCAVLWAAGLYTHLSPVRSNSASVSPHASPGRIPVSNCNSTTARRCVLKEGRVVATCFGSTGLTGSDSRALCAPLLQPRERPERLVHTNGNQFLGSGPFEHPFDEIHPAVDERASPSRVDHCLPHGRAPPRSEFGCGV